MRPLRVFETVLYADDLEAAERFYHEILGLEVISHSELVLSLRCQDGVILIFDPALSSPPGREVPSHGARGPGHVAFRADDTELEDWKQRLLAAGIVLDAEVSWSQGGRSLYLRDPAGNSVEFAPATLWGGGWD